MRIYEFTLKYPIFIKKNNEVVRVKIVRFEFKPEYHIENDVVYVDCCAKTMFGSFSGLHIFLPIVDSVEEFKEKIKDD